jgi:hypothetical protein
MKNAASAARILAIYGAEDVNMPGFSEVEPFRPLPIPRWLQPRLQKIFGKGI